MSANQGTHVTALESAILQAKQLAGSAHPATYRKLAEAFDLAEREDLPIEQRDFLCFCGFTCVSESDWDRHTAQMKAHQERQIVSAPNPAPPHLQRAAARSIEDCACKAASARLMWVGGDLYGWWVTLHILNSAIVHAIASYAGPHAGHWVAGKGIIPPITRHGLVLADA